MKKVKIGLLPLFIALYDIGGRSSSRDVLEPFYDEVASMFENKGFEVVKVPFCRVEAEFEAAVSKFEAENADVIVTLHEAYSPSLESLRTLITTKLPIVVCDATVTYDFNPMQDSIHIDYNHGIHGVMDMCSMLKQNGKKYAIAAGHYKESDVIDRTAGLVRAAVAAKSMNGLKVGSVGGSFEGMGDFLISKEDIKKNFGVDAFYADPEELTAMCDALTDADIQAVAEDYKADYANFDEIDKDDIAPAIKAGAVTRKWIEKYGLNAFTVNFLKIGDGSGVPSMPFAEACTQMKKGLGYAGEGDILTASLCGALMNGFNHEDISFMEIFCPDWKGNRLFVSHMGEMNISAADEKPILVRNGFRYAPGVKHTYNPAAEFKPGKIAFINLCKDNLGYKLVTSQMEVDETFADNFTTSVRGWLKPSMPVADFLEAISRAGATHHSVLAYGVRSSEVQYFADLLGIRAEVI